MTYDEMARKIENGNRTEVVEAIRALPPLDAFLCAVDLRDRLDNQSFWGFWKLVRITN